MLLETRVSMGENLSSFLIRFNTVAPPALAKNVITVGATHSMHVSQISEGVNYVTYFSSRGDPQKKRILPDIVTTGMIESAKSLSEQDCRNNCNDHQDVIVMGGTYPCLRPSSFVFLNTTSMAFTNEARTSIAVG